ncbi:glycoside hydrolase family 78 protein [Wolfiporia cocos MD-104 SS10]|uniref:Glycoside hydrolase family 78 protein n=1 Tax=Wolfiporia cocos (strain MD-104) TaxID=742152 RepID=A0A2H3JM58_WOLCO|nr:glycoside hydrolase family 78 protein [Wolfiporia cocos MD-104 SS10]
MILSFLVALSAVTAVFCGAPSGPWDAFNYAPESKIVYPRAIRELNGTVLNAGKLLTSGSATLTGSGSYVALDFGIEIGGLISLNFDNVSSSSSIALSFTESPLFISPRTSDDSVLPTANMSYDGVLNIAAPLEIGHWTMPTARLRGGFRYLTIVSTSDDSVTISNVSCAITFMPHVDNLREYSGYFYASDPVYWDSNFLIKIWYSGAYTVQTDIIAADSGRQVPFVSSPGWSNDATIGVASPVIVDGAKRDRDIWPGDMGIAVPTQFVSTNDLIATRNALETLFAQQNAETGALPYCGAPLCGTFVPPNGSSDTYHAWTIIGAYNYYLYSGDTEWLQKTWSNYTKAVRFLTNKVDDTGLLNVTAPNDWGRIGQGGHNSEANAIYYKVLTNSAALASLLNDTELATSYTANASALKSVYNEAFWLEDEGMYRDNETTTLCPQDGNSLAVLFNVTESAEQASAISEGLTRNWNEYGAVSPECPDTIAPYIGGFELQAHFVSGNDERALEFLRLQWGYMLYTNISVQSTLLEGYTANGSLYYRSANGYNYDASYTSHAHGWSTGPTSALTFYVLGLTVTSPQGQTWSIAPHTSGLPSAQGGFETALGWFGVDWASSTDAFSMSISTPTGTSGVVVLPINGTVTVDGSVRQVNSTVQLEGGNHTVIVRA